MKKYIYAAALLIATACQKEITLPYRSIDPVAVIEGSICQDSAIVRLSTTLDMDSPFTSAHACSGADVTITTDGMTVKMVEDSAGVYKPAEEFRGTEGKEYKLSVSWNGDTYSSTSVMHPGFQVIKSGFQTIDLVGYKSWLYAATILDTPGEENYYAYYFYEDGELFYWDMTYDMGVDGEPISVEIPVESDDEAVNGTDMHHTLPDGGTAVLEIRSIDKKTFNYLYSLAVTGLSYCNALQDFDVTSSKGETPKCLGYFNAYSSVRLTEVFHREATFPEDE